MDFFGFLLDTVASSLNYIEYEADLGYYLKDVDNTPTTLFSPAARPIRSFFDRGLHAAELPNRAAIGTPRRGAGRG